MTQKGMFIIDEKTLIKRIGERTDKAQRLYKAANDLRHFGKSFKFTYDLLSDDAAQEATYARRALITLVDMKCEMLGHVPADRKPYR